MSKIRNPQEKKRLRLTKDRRNSYGENDKSSRKNIKRNKRLEKKGIRAERRRLSTLTGSGLTESESLLTESSLLSREKYKKASGFKKVSDRPLSEHILTTQRGRASRDK
jgi:hypothetical protein